MSLTRDERDRFAASTPTEIEYSEGACVETPRRLFELLHARFKFDVDLTANEGNHLLPYWFGPGSPAAPDALTHSWTNRLAMSVTFQEEHYTGGWIDVKDPKAGFSNPTYGKFIPKILKKAIEERAKGFTSVFLLPMRAAGWFRDLVLPQYSELWYCSERIAFHYQGKPRPTSQQRWVRAFDNEPGLIESPKGYTSTSTTSAVFEYPWKDTWGTTWHYQADPGQPVLVPAGALFDSIIVVYAPYDRAKWGLFPPPQRPNIWEVRTGELRF